MRAEHSLLLLIDFQARLLPAILDGDAALARARTLSQGAGILAVPRLITEHCADKIGATTPALAADAIPVIAKTSFGAWPADGFEAALQGRRDIVVAGVETHVCVLQTVMQLLERDYRVWIAADAVGSRRAEDKALGLQRMAAAGARIVTSEMVLFEWLGHAGHPSFRPVMALIK
jgi:nicotinamidase-related amidase